MTRAAAVALVALTLAGVALGAERPPQPDPHPSAGVGGGVAYVALGDGSLVEAVIRARRAANRCRRAIGRPRFPVSYMVERSASLRFRKWALTRWRARARACTVELERLSWLRAVAIVDRHLGHGEWLRSCSAPRSEGGHGRWYWNGGYLVDEAARRRALRGDEPYRPRGSSGAGGWLQFLRGTFDSAIGPGVARARRAGLHVPPLARSWFHPLGQAVAAVAMLEAGRRGEWYGRGC